MKQLTMEWKATAVLRLRCPKCNTHVLYVHKSHFEGSEDADWLACHCGEPFEHAAMEHLFVQDVGNAFAIDGAERLFGLDVPEWKAVEIPFRPGMAYVEEGGVYPR